MRLIRNTNSNVNPSDDAKLFNRMFPDGIFNSVEITSLGANQVNIPALYGIVQGRDFTTENTNINVKLPTSDTTKGYVVLKINLANSDTPLSFETYLSPYTPTVQDINNTGTITEMILAEYECTAVSVTSIKNVYPKSIGFSELVNKTQAKHSGSIMVPQSLWQPYPYAEYGPRYQYWAKVPVAGITEKTFVEVIFHDVEWENNNLGSLVFTKDGLVEIYAATIPPGQLEIRDIIYWEYL